MGAHAGQGLRSRRLLRGLSGLGPLRTEPEGQPVASPLAPFRFTRQSKAPLRLAPTGLIFPARGRCPDHTGSWTSWPWRPRPDPGRGLRPRQNLPLIQPLAYHLSLTWNYQKFSVALDASGNATQNHYGQTYGEQKTDDFSIYNLNTSYQFKWKQAQLLIKLGVENLTDKYYTTYSDWNKIPRMGRNVFINLTTHLF